ncbi:aspartate--tRNA ligase dps1 [Marasmius crinis-equi]|uniref:Aspartate--tRNA ligase dps1 n=1 Tax=Marasmius crinis-equi TaxID=585013 RepID=A0ABR3EZM3_9AGAR
MLRTPQDIIHQTSDRTQLENRVIDIRSPVTQTIFRIQSTIPSAFRSYLDTQGFIEIHTPKLQVGAIDSGSSVFPVKYFGRKAFLAQSPKLGKQMSISGDLGRVYEVGPVFRAENFNTHRHMTEFTGLDLEMTLEEHYLESAYPSGDLVWLDKFPAGPRPFYTMLDPEDERRTTSFDISVRGQEILTGGQRVHDARLLEARMGKLGVSVVGALREYVQSFRWGCVAVSASNDLRCSSSTSPTSDTPPSSTVIPNPSPLIAPLLLSVTLNAIPCTHYGINPRRSKPTVQEKVETLMPLEKLVVNYGDASNTSWTDPRYSVWRHLKTGAAVGYVPSKGYAIVAGDPLCDPKQYLEVIHACLPWVRKEVGKPIWMLVSASVEGILGGGGVGEWKTLSCVAEDQTDTVDNHAKKDSTVQKKVRKAKKEGVRVLEYNGRERAALSSTTSSAVTSKMTSPMPSTTNLPSPEPKHPDQGEVGPIPEDIRKKVDERMEEWAKERKDKGKQVHLTGLDPWRDWEHRMYFIGTTTDKESGETKVHALVVLTQLAPQHGWQVKWALDFNGAPSGTIEHTVLTALDAAASSGATSVTFGAGATASLATNHGFSHRNLFVKSLEHLYQVLATEFKLFGKSEFRAKMGAVEDPVYVCFSKGAMGVRGLKALLNFVGEGDE